MLWWVTTAAAAASGLVVEVVGATTGPEDVACRLYDVHSAAGFPGGTPLGETASTVDERGHLVCQFADLKPGRYAVAAIADVNGNRALDTTSFGQPLEPWGVSNNVRPTFRAPTFDESALLVTGASVRHTRVVLRD